MSAWTEEELGRIDAEDELRISTRRRDGTLRAPVTIWVVRLGDDVFIGGQPTERALRELKEQGVTTVVNLRTPEEMTRFVTFDEAALVRSLGMTYVYIPMRGTAEFPYSPAAVTKFAEAMRGANGKVLLHCTVAWRASHLWGAYLIKERGIRIDSALANARAINLGDERPPIEQFLDQALPTYGRSPRSP